MSGRRRKVEPFLAELVEAIPRAIHDAGLKPNACILAGRLGVEALRAQGFRARPLSVMLRVANPAYQRMLEAAEKGELDGETWLREGAWSVEIGHGRGSMDGWDGHLVIVVEERYVLDLTAGQVKRLKKSIEARPFWHEAPELVRGEVQVFENDDGCWWVYEPRPGDRSFLSAPAWCAYRVRRVANGVVSERHGPAAVDYPVAPAVLVRLEA